MNQVFGYIRKYGSLGLAKFLLFLKWSLAVHFWWYFFAGLGALSVLTSLVLSLVRESKAKRAARENEIQNLKQQLGELAAALQIHKDDLNSHGIPEAIAASYQTQQTVMGDFVNGQISLLKDDFNTFTDRTRAVETEVKNIHALADSNAVRCFEIWGRLDAKDTKTRRRSTPKVPKQK